MRYVRVRELAVYPKVGLGHFPVRQPWLGLWSRLPAARPSAAGPRPRYHPLRHVRLVRCGARRTDPRSRPPGMEGVLSFNEGLQSSSECAARNGTGPWQRRPPRRPAGAPATSIGPTPLSQTGLLWPECVSCRSQAAGRSGRSEQVWIRPVGSRLSGISVPQCWAQAQVPYNLLRREPEQTPTAVTPPPRDALVVAARALRHRPPLGRLPSGQTRDGNLANPEPLYSSDSLGRTAGLVETLGEVARAHDATMAQVALAYVLRHPNVVAIPGAANAGQLAENAAASDLELQEDECQGLAGPPASARHMKRAHLGRGSGPLSTGSEGPDCRWPRRGNHRLEAPTRHDHRAELINRGPPVSPSRADGVDSRLFCSAT